MINKGKKEAGPGEIAVQGQINRKPAAFGISHLAVACVVLLAIYLLLQIFLDIYKYMDRWALDNFG